MERENFSVAEQEHALSAEEQEQRRQRMLLLIGEARAFAATHEVVLEEAEALDEEAAADIKNRVQGIVDTALGRASLRLEMENGVPTGEFLPDADEVSAEDVDDFIKDVQGGTNLLEGLRATIAEKKG